MELFADRSYYLELVYPPLPNGQPNPRAGHTALSLSHDGQEIFVYPEDITFAKQMARGVFHLGLFTPNVEAVSVSGAAISGHERMEWALEYEARMGALL